MAVDEGSIGNTPLVELDLDVPPLVVAKVEWLNCHACPYAGSLKARIAKRMLDEAAVRGRTVVEPSSGNTGRALARIGEARGHDVRVVMPADAARGKREGVRAAGGELDLVPAAAGYDAVIERSRDLAAREDFVRLDQYENPANPNAHAATTAVELREQAPDLTHVVAGVGTGGTVTGLARGLPDATVVGVEPTAEDHDIGGLKFLCAPDAYHPGTFEAGRVDRTVYLDTEAAYARVRSLRDRYADRSVTIADAGQYDRSLVADQLRVDGAFLPGISSGAVVEAVHRLADAGKVGADDTVAAVFADRGDVYPTAPI
ncbi:MAG: PLP-dependent cysteine synthase family protein [Halobacteriaceae archaeon]